MSIRSTLQNASALQRVQLVAGSLAGAAGTAYIAGPSLKDFAIGLAHATADMFVTGAQQVENLTEGFDPKTAIVALGAPATAAGVISLAGRVVNREAEAVAGIAEDVVDTAEAFAETIEDQING